MGALRAGASAACLGMVILGLALVQPLCFVAALPLAAWLLLGFVSGRPEPLLEAHRTPSSTFPEPGSRVAMSLVVRNSGAALPFLRLADALLPGMSLVEGEPTWEGELAEGGEARIDYSAVFDRGAYEFVALEALAEYPVSAMRTSLSLACPATLIAPPPAMVPPRQALSARSARPFSGTSRLRRRGSGTDFAGTREYSPGDPLRSLNWRAEALWDLGIVNVFEEERAIDVEIILDARAEAYESLVLFEAAAAAAGSMAERFLSEGDRVGFLCYGSAIEWIQPGSGREQRLRIRRAVGKAALGTHPVFERFDSIPVGLFPPGSLILLVSPLLGVDLLPLRSLASLGYAVTVLRPDPLSAQEARAEGPGSEALARRICALEAEVLMSRLLRAGIEILDWKVSRPLAAAVLHAGGRP